MANWYRCADVKSAVDAYDALGVEPGPATAGYTPLQRSSALSMVSEKHITECFHRTLQFLGDDSERAVRVSQYYAMLQGKTRQTYDMKLMKESTQAQKYSKCIIVAKNSIVVLIVFQICFCFIRKTRGKSLILLN